MELSHGERCGNWSLFIWPLFIIWMKWCRGIWWLTSYLLSQLAQNYFPSEPAFVYDASGNSIRKYNSLDVASVNRDGTQIDGLSSRIPSCVLQLVGKHKIAIIVLILSNLKELLLKKVLHLFINKRQRKVLLQLRRRERGGNRRQSDPVISCGEWLKKGQCLTYSLWCWQ